MARVPEVNREDLLPEQQHIFDEIGRSRNGRVGAPFKILLNSPEAAGRVAHLGAYVRFESTLSPVQHSLTALTVAREMDCQFEWTVNEGSGRAAGVREEAIEALRHRRAPEGLTPEETVVVRYGQELLRNQRVSDETYQAAVQLLGRQGVTDLTVSYGYYTFVACAMNAFEVEPDLGRRPTLPIGLPGEFAGAPD